MADGRAWTRAERIAHLHLDIASYEAVAADFTRRGWIGAATANRRHAESIRGHMTHFLGSTVPGPEGSPQPADGPGAVKGA